LKGKDLIKIFVFVLLNNQRPEKKKKKRLLNKLKQQIDRKKFSEREKNSHFAL
jgi:hypothetical protein